MWSLVQTCNCKNLMNMCTVPAIKKKQAEEKNEFKKVGRNEKCPCGSGKKYKHCHGNI